MSKTITITLTDKQEKDWEKVAEAHRKMGKHVSIENICADAIDRFLFQFRNKDGAVNLMPAELLPSEMEMAYSVRSGQHQPQSKPCFYIEDCSMTGAKYCRIVSDGVLIKAPKEQVARK